MHLRLSKTDEISNIQLPIVFNVSYISAETTIQLTGQAARKRQVLTVNGTGGLTGSAIEPVVLTEASPHPTVNKICRMLS